MISKEIFYKFCEEGEFSKIKLFYKYMNLTDDEKYFAFAISIDNQKELNEKWHFANTCD